MSFEVKEESKNYFSQIPNIICELELDTYEKSFYLEMKKICGEQSICFKSMKTLEKELGMSETKIKDIKKKLSSPFEKLNKKPLIIITKRFKEDGSPDTDLITLTDIWLENVLYFQNKNRGGSPGDGGVGRQKTQGGSPNAYKEEPSEEEPSEEDPLLKEPILTYPFSPTSLSLPEIQERLGKEVFKKENLEIRKILKGITFEVEKEQHEKKEGESPYKEIPLTEEQQMQITGQYSLEQLNGALCWMEEEQEKGTNIKDSGYLFWALKNGKRGLTDEDKANIQFFREMRQKHDLNNVELFDGYVADLESGKDLYYKKTPFKTFCERFIATFIKPKETGVSA